MNPELLNRLKPVTAEEREILAKGGIDRSRYMHGDSAVIDRALLPDPDKLITLRPHPRFAYFPRHTHNYVEMVYMCQGQTVHLVDGHRVTLKAGEILLLSQNAAQEILPASEDDIAVNFIIRPPFFETALQLTDGDSNLVREFLLGCLRGKKEGLSFLHFRVAHVLPIQNLMENLIWTLSNPVPNKRTLNQLTVGLLILHLVNHTENLHDGPGDERHLMFRVLRYAEERYRDGTLTELAGLLHYDAANLSREIKKQSGKTFTELMQDKRLNQAAFLLKTTGKKVSEICESVGYENQSHFHRLFKERFGVSPRRYRTGK